MELPVYKTIYSYVKEQIHSGVLKPEDRIPSERELSLAFNVSRITSKRALDLLAERGFIIRRQGKGSFVLPPAKKQEPEDLDDSLQERKYSRKLLGLIVPDISDTFGLDLIVGFEGYCFDNNINFIFKRSYGNIESENIAISALLEAGADGIGIMPLHGEFYNPYILQLIFDGFPIVIVDRHYPGIQACFVGTDNISSAKKATAYLLQKGHRHIAFLSPPIQGNSALTDRMQGITLTYEEAGIKLDRSLWFDQINSTLPQKNKEETLEANRHILMEHFKNNPQITAVFAAEYNIALLCKQALQALGLRIPQDVSVVCFDSPTRLDNDYEFTHIKQNEVFMAQYIVEKLIDFQSGETNNFHLFEGKFRLGRSTDVSRLLHESFEC